MTMTTEFYEARKDIADARTAFDRAIQDTVVASYELYADTADDNEKAKDYRDRANAIRAEHE
jgi:hypothetical protein